MTTLALILGSVVGAFAACLAWALFGAGMGEVLVLYFGSALAMTTLGAAAEWSRGAALGPLR